MERRLFLTLAAAGIVAGPAAAEAAGPDISRFLPDFYAARATAAADIKVVHDAAAAGSAPWTAADVTQLDLAYAGLSAAANAFVKTIATEIRLNQMNESRWKTDADAIVKRASDFDGTVHEISRRQAPAPTRGIGSAPASASSGGAVATLAALVPVASGLVGLASSVFGLMKSAADRKAAERVQLAAVLESDAQWPDLQAAIKGESRTAK